MINIWKQLGIEPTSDKKAIKRAYAAKVKNCHQEDEPEKWQELHEAYERALKYAQRRAGRGGQNTGRAPSVDIQIPTKQNAEKIFRQEEERQQENGQLPREEERQQENGQLLQKEERQEEEKSLEEAFSRLEERALMQKEERQKEVCARLQELYKVEAEKQKDAWLAFLDSWQARKFYQETFFWDAVLAELKRHPIGSSEACQAVELFLDQLRSAPEMQEVREHLEVICSKCHNNYVNCQKEEAIAARSQIERKYRLNRERLQELLRMIDVRQADAWSQYLDLKETRELCVEMRFWEEFPTEEELRRLNKDTYFVLEQKLSELSEILAGGLLPEIADRIERLKKFCQSRLGEQKSQQMQSEVTLVRQAVEQSRRNGTGGSSREKSAKSSHRAVKIIVGFALAFLVLQQILRFWHGETQPAGNPEVTEVLAAYLNEKYQTDEYRADQFEPEEVWVSRLGDEGMMQIEAGYSVTSTVDEDFKAYALLKKDENGENRYVCFDNLQIEELEEALCTKLQALTGIVDGQAFLGRSANNMEVSCIKYRDVVYHTLFEGDVDAFCAAEEEIRNTVFAPYYSKLLYEYTGVVNGAVYFYYPDGQIKNMQERLAIKEYAFDESLPDQLEAFEEETALQVFVTGLPQEYYQALFLRPGEEEAKEIAERLRGNRYYYDYDFPVNPAFTTAGYWKNDYNAVTVSWGDLFGNPWEHVQEAIPVADGIYTIKEVNSNELIKTEPVITVNAEIDLEQKQIQFSSEDGELERYIFIVEKEVFGIEGEYQAVTGSGSEFWQDDYTYLDMNDTLYEILEGEGFLIISVYYDLPEEEKIILSWE